MMTIDEIHDKIEISYQALLSMRGQFGDTAIKGETIFAIGTALGTVARVRDLIKRDVEDAKAKAR